MNTKHVLFHLVSLGCEKNTVDSERLLALMAQSGFVYTPEPRDAAICLVNTCGFIQSAREEAAEVMNELAALRSHGRPLIVAMGCLVERLQQHPDFSTFMQEADALVPFARYRALPEMCRELLEGQAAPSFVHTGKMDKRFYDLPRMLTGSGVSATVKISEGCSNCCHYCAIPLIRGEHISRPMAAIILEVQQLLEAGVQEIILIAQDTSAYGIDSEGKAMLPELIYEILRIEGPFWLRIMYCHPAHLTEDILRAMASDVRCCPYFDLPLQHVNDEVLASMGRPVTRSSIDTLLHSIHTLLPSALLRTTFIVGFPTETPARFEELLDFVKQGYFVHAGAFTYSPEPGTPAFHLGDPISAEEKERRYDRLMEAQQEASKNKLLTLRNTTQEVLIERGFERSRRIGRHGIRWQGRIQGQAPDVDGVTFLPKSPFIRQAGQRIKAAVIGSMEYDLIAKALPSK